MTDPKPRFTPTDDLVEQLRRVADDALYGELFGSMAVIHEGADRIEALIAILKELEAERDNLLAVGYGG